MIFILEIADFTLRRLTFWDIDYLRMSTENSYFFDGVEMVYILLLLVTGAVYVLFIIYFLNSMNYWDIS